MTPIATALQDVHARIQGACRDSGLPDKAVRLMAVSKTFDADAVLQAIEAGQLDFGENYVQEGVEKIQQVALALGRDPEQRLGHSPGGNLACWHFIGPLQSNKTKDVAEHFDWVHSIDRLKIAQRLLDQRPDHLKPLQICLQVNTSGEASKSGVEPEQALDLAREIAQAIADHPRGSQAMVLRGLMTIPEPSQDDALTLGRFKRLVQIKDDIRQSLTELGQDRLFDVLSMGMSADLELAIAASEADATTWVRVGTAIFGARPIRTTS
jgi:pyridoxal phosphate enzyme (YggS family)